MTTNFGTSLASVSFLRPIFATTNNLGLCTALAIALAIAVAALVLFARYIRAERSAVSQPAQTSTKSVTNAALRFTVAGGTHIGGRDNNEDAYLINGNVLVIADGMGGQANGEVASNAVIEAFSQIDPTADTWLSDGILGGNAKMRGLLAADAQLKNFGTTVVAARYDGTDMELGSSGDSHFFRLRGGVLERLTEEHSLAMALVKSGQISLSEVPTHRFRNTLYRFIGGTQKDPEWDTRQFSMESGDVYLLCSDGLVDYSSLVRIQQILASSKSAQEVVGDLLVNAVTDNTKDNATAIVVQVA